MALFTERHSFLMPTYYLFSSYLFDHFNNSIDVGLCTFSIQHYNNIFFFTGKRHCLKFLCKALAIQDSLQII